MYFFAILFCVSLAMTLQGVSTGPTNDNYGIPRKIWQTYRYKELPRPAEEARATWINQNPNYEYHFMDDIDIENYILNIWDAETYEFFRSFPIGVMKADLWRYLIIADQGGVYTDIDSVCSLPIDYWTALLGPLNKIETGKPLLFIGLENECVLCQWTIMATPKHPAMEFARKYIVDKWQKNRDLCSGGFVMSVTGPVVWSSAMMKYLGEPESTCASIIWNKYNSDKSYKQKINDLGVYLLSDQFYNGFALVHLNGSAKFGEGYISWLQESYLYKSMKKLEKLEELE